MLLSVSAATLPVLFQDAAAQVLAQLIDPAEIGEALQEKLVVEAEDVSSLMEAWLNALLGLLRDENILPKRILVERLVIAAGNPYALRAQIIGELRDPRRHSYRILPQALQIGETTLEPNEAGWSAQISLQTG